MQCHACQAEVQGPNFCQNCGQRLGSSRLMAFYGVGIIVALLLAWFTYGWIEPKINFKGAPDHGVHSANDGHDHDHDHAEGETHDGEGPLGKMTQQEKDTFMELTRKAGSGNPEDILNLADFFLHMGLKDPQFYRESITAHQRLLEKYPDHGYSLKQVADLYFELGDHQSAVASYKAYLDRYPGDANAIADLGVQLFYLGELEAAEVAYEKALEFFPNFYNVYVNLEQLHKKNGDLDKANQARAKADSIEKEFGRKLAPAPVHSRLPEGDPAPASEPETSDPTLEDYFRSHKIIGPKLVSYREQADKAMVMVRDFPVEQMPDMAKQVFETKVRAELEGTPITEVLFINEADNALLMTIQKVP